MRSTIFAVCVFAANTVIAAGFVITSEGQPRCQLVLSAQEKAPPMQFAAQELQRYVKAMSGATLQIVDAPTDEPFIALNTDPQAKPAGPGELSPTREDRYGWIITDRRIDISGASPRAVLFAVYDLLERLGCGFCVPGDDTVPKRASLAIVEGKMETEPVFHIRKQVDFPMETIPQSTAIIDWMAKNRMNWYHPAENAMGEPKKWYEWREKLLPEVRKRGLHLEFGGHTMHTWLPEAYFKEHPEWFMYKDGIRKGPTLCVTNVDMTGELVRNMQKFLDRCPEVEIIDLWHPDSDAYCHCVKCTRGIIPESARGKLPETTPIDAVRAAYTISYVEFVNRVGAAFAKSHPKVLVSPLIYGPVETPMPDAAPPLADNLLLALAHISRDSYIPLAGDIKSERNFRFLALDLTWMARSKHTYIYEYYNCWLAPYISPQARLLVRDLQILRDVGQTGSSSDLWGYTPVNMYVATRAMWDPEIAWEDAVRDYSMRYFGDVGEEMADNTIEIENGVFGKAGWQPGGAPYADPGKRAPAGQYFNDVRPKQIALLDRLIAKTGNPQVKARFEREALPWKMFNDKPRWWAFPKFEASAN